MASRSVPITWFTDVGVLRCLAHMASDPSIPYLNNAAVITLRILRMIEVCQMLCDLLLIYILQILASQRYQNPFSNSWTSSSGPFCYCVWSLLEYGRSQMGQLWFGANFFGDAQVRISTRLMNTIWALPTISCRTLQSIQQFVEQYAQMGRFFRLMAFLKRRKIKRFRKLVADVAGRLDVRFQSWPQLVFIT